MRELYSLGIQVDFAPPDCTAILQPMDHCLNRLFKLYYRAEFIDWFRTMGWKDKTAGGHYRKPRTEQVMKMMTAAFYQLTQQNIERSWQHTLSSMTTIKRACQFITAHRDALKEDIKGTWLRNSHQQELINERAISVSEAVEAEEESLPEILPSAEQMLDDAALDDNDVRRLHRMGML